MKLLSAFAAWLVVLGFIVAWLRAAVENERRRQEALERRQEEFAEVRTGRLR